ncbi:LysR substrate-binding domain-containing protein [Polyangium sp. 15x6]|uniref:LysR family transcriptional regulator n=1 Tax=Polyangium sp. 15x6 TaxID=3042687 RepID=UPI00249C948A|nr:LysR substrate-binding domain-containing protein [Polyangium sp. 15x6]MDI3290125.1 LysR substrate-binding domain-containing protein [Polyangium sp. 15x6]
MLDALRHFVLIAEHGTFTRAARHAHLSQPALTASIQRLEEAFGARLLHRDRAGTSLTAAGRVLLPRALHILAAVGDAMRAVAEVEGLEAGEVRLGAGATACTYLLPPTLSAFRATHPGVRFRLREATTAEVLDALERGEIDLGVVTHPEGEPWIDDQLILVAAPGLPTEGAPFVTFGRGSTTRALLDQHFPDADVVMELGSIAAVKGNVRAGIGVALVSRFAVEHDLALGRLVEVPHPATPIVRPMHIVHRGEDRLPPAAAALRHLLLARRAARAKR